jgi:hypothetical protein
VRVRADQAYAGEAARDQAADEREPGRSVFGGDESRPSDSRKPSRLTPTACTTQTLTVRPTSRHLITSASNVTYAYGAPSSGRVRKSSTIPSRLFASRETWLLLIRSTPSCCTSFSTRRVEAPAR